MEIFFSVTTYFSELLRPFTSYIAVGLVATLLMLTSGSIKKMVKTPIKKFHYLIRLTIIILLSAVGFTILASLANMLITDGLTALPDRWFSVVVVGSFVVLGLIAEKQRVI